MKKRKLKIRENKQQAKPIKTYVSRNKRTAKREYNYSPERLANQLWERAKRHEFNSEATIYLFTEQAFKETVKIEFGDPNYSKDKKKKFEEVKKILTRSRMFMPLGEIGRQNILNSLRKWDMLETLEEAAGETIQPSQIHAVDKETWVYWTMDKKPIMISFMTAAGYTSRPEIRGATSSEMQYFEVHGYNA